MNNGHCIISHAIKYQLFPNSSCVTTRAVNTDTAPLLRYSLVYCLLLHKYFQQYDHDWNLTVFLIFYKFSRYYLTSEMYSELLRKNLIHINTS